MLDEPLSTGPLPVIVDSSWGWEICHLRNMIVGTYLGTYPYEVHDPSKQMYPDG